MLLTIKQPFSPTLSHASMMLTIQRPYMVIQESFITCFPWDWWSNSRFQILHRTYNYILHSCNGRCSLANAAQNTPVICHLLLSPIASTLLDPFPFIFYCELETTYWCLVWTQFKMKSDGMSSISTMPGSGNLLPCHFKSPAAGLKSHWRLWIMTHICSCSYKYFNIRVLL